MAVRSPAVPENLAVRTIGNDTRTLSITRLKLGVVKSTRRQAPWVNVPGSSTVESSSKATYVRNTGLRMRTRFESRAKAAGLGGTDKARSGVAFAGRSLS